jgi:hypothetical protein
MAIPSYNNRPIAASVVLGKNTNTDKDITITDDERVRHISVVGATGTRKSTLLKSMALQAVKNGESLIYIDVDYRNISDLLVRIPQERMKDVIYLDFNVETSKDIQPTDRFIGINHLAGKTRRDVERYVELFKRLWKIPPEFPNLELTLRSSLLTLWYNKATLTEMPDLLRDKEFRSRCIAHIPMSPNTYFISQFWEKIFLRHDIQEQVRLADSTLNKGLQLLIDTSTFYIVSQETTTLHLEDIIENHKILLIRLSKRILGDETVRKIGAMILEELKHALFSRPDLPQLDIVNLICDEWQMYLTPDFFEDVLSQGRRYGISTVLATQTLANFDDKLQAILDQVGTHITFAVGVKDAYKLAPFYAKDPPPAEMETKPIFERQGHWYEYTVTTWEPKEKEEEYFKVQIELNKLRRQGSKLFYIKFDEWYIKEFSTRRLDELEDFCQFAKQIFYFIVEDNPKTEKYRYMAFTPPQLLAPPTNEGFREIASIENSLNKRSGQYYTYSGELTPSSIEKQLQDKIKRYRYEEIKQPALKLLQQLEERIRRIHEETLYRYIPQNPNHEAIYTAEDRAREKERKRMKEEANTKKKKFMLLFYILSIMMYPLILLSIVYMVQNWGNGALAIVGIAAFFYMIFTHYHNNSESIVNSFTFLFRWQIILADKSFKEEKENYDNEEFNKKLKKIQEMKEKYQEWERQLEEKCIDVRDSNTNHTIGYWYFQPYTELYTWFLNELENMHQVVKSKLEITQLSQEPDIAAQIAILTAKEEELLKYRTIEEKRDWIDRVKTTDYGDSYSPVFKPLYDVEVKAKVSYSESRSYDLRYEDYLKQEHPGSDPLPVSRTEGRSISSEEVRTQLYTEKQGKPTRTVTDMRNEKEQELLRDMPDGIAYVSMRMRGGRFTPRMETYALDDKHPRKGSLEKRHSQALENAIPYTTEVRTIDQEFWKRRQSFGIAPSLVVQPPQEEKSGYAPEPVSYAKRRTKEISLSLIPESHVPDSLSEENLLRLLYLFGYLDIENIARLVHQLPSRESVKEHHKNHLREHRLYGLNKLVSDGFIKVNNKPREELARGRIPIVYSLTDRGIQRLKERKAKAELGKHLMQLNDLLVSAVLLPTVEPCITRVYFEHEYLLRQHPIPIGNNKAVVPDGIVLYSLGEPYGEKGEVAGICFEWDEGTESPYQLQDKFNDWITAASGAYQDRFKIKSLTIAFCCENENRARTLKNLAERTLEKENKKSWGELFVFGAFDPAAIDPLTLMTTPLFQQAFDTTAHAIIEKLNSVSVKKEEEISQPTLTSNAQLEQELKKLRELYDQLTDDGSINPSLEFEEWRAQEPQNQLMTWLMELKDAQQ